MDQAKNWQHLPNADHIDWVLESLKENHTLWAEACPAWDAVQVLDPVYAARDVSGSTWSGLHVAARDAAFDSFAAGYDAYVDAWPGARSAIAALIVYNDCDQYLAMGYEKLLVYAILSEKPQAQLLLPMAYVLEKTNEKALV